MVAAAAVRPPRRRRTASNVSADPWLITSDAAWALRGSISRSVHGRRATADIGTLPPGTLRLARSTYGGPLRATRGARRPPRRRANPRRIPPMRRHSVTTCRAATDAGGGQELAARPSPAPSTWDGSRAAPECGGSPRRTGPRVGKALRRLPLDRLRPMSGLPARGRELLRPPATSAARPARRAATPPT